jgi:hypothetical protein
MVRSYRPELTRYDELQSELHSERGRWARMWREEPVETAFFGAFIASLA